MPKRKAGPEQPPAPASWRVRSAEELRRKIAETRERVAVASRPAGPLSLFKLTTST